MSTRENSQALGLLAAFATASVVFTLWPGIDLWASGLFYAPGQGFPLAGSLLVSAVRHTLRIVMTLFPVVTLGLLLASLSGFRPWAVPPGLWGYITALFLAGPLLIVNIVLKNTWGRARPDEIVAFGGDAAFTPALRVAHECARNCSFVSGEGAGATALGIAMVLLAPYVLARWPAGRRRKALGWALLAPAVAIVLRVATGRHFLSDTVFAILIVLAVAAALRPVFVSSLPQRGIPPR